MCQYPKSKCTDEAAITEAVKLAEEMLKIAERGFANCDDDGCMLIFGVIRDCGYKIRRTADLEQSGAQ